MLRGAHILVVGLLAIASPAVAAELKLTGLEGQVRTVGEAELKALPRVELKLATPDVAPYQGATVLSLLASAGLASAEPPRGPGLAVVAVFRASDGYVVALPLADLYPEFREGRVVLADSFDGKPLEADEGPFRLVVEGDKRPARSAHSVVAIELRSLR